MANTESAATAKALKRCADAMEENGMKESADYWRKVAHLHEKETVIFLEFLLERVRFLRGKWLGEGHYNEN